MTSVVTWYDVLGTAGRDAGRHPRSVAGEKGCAPAAQAGGGPPDVLSAADRALKAVDEAWRVLADPAAREAYDEAVGLQRPGQGLADEQALEPYPSPPSRLVAPDVVGGQPRTGSPGRTFSLPVPGGQMPDSVDMVLQRSPGLGDGAAWGALLGRQLRAGAAVAVVTY